MVEQWPFKPFVTGSNPVRPKRLLFLISILLISHTQISFGSPEEIRITSKENTILSGDLYKHEKSDSIYLIVHGTRGFKRMEIIKSLSEGIFHQGHDVLSINLSYDIDDRGNNFLSCDIIHTHNEHKSVREIIDWYRYIEGKNYKDIIFIGHSRGAFNIIQAQSLINNKRIQSYLLAPVIDTYKGTKQYYMNEHNLPYDEVINSEDEFIISDKHPPINFLFCENARVSSSTFRSYMDFSGKMKSYPFTFDLIDLIEKINSKVKIISGTDDEILLDSYKQFETIENENINHILIEGGDHFFRDIYMDDVLEIIFN